GARSPRPGREALCHQGGRCRGAGGISAQKQADPDGESELSFFSWSSGSARIAKERRPGSRASRHRPVLVRLARETLSTPNEPSHGSRNGGSSFRSGPRDLRGESLIRTGARMESRTEPIPN